MNIKIKDNKLGLIGDLHLGKHNDEKWDKVYDDLKDWIIESMSEVDTLMFLGDVFDGHKEKTNEKSITFKMMDYVSNFFTDLSKKFKIIIYAGNHCCYYKNRCDISGLAMLKNRPNITIIEKTTVFKIGDKKYKIVPWSCDYTIGGKVDGVFCHMDITSFMMSNTKVSDHGVTSTDLFKITDKVYTGHYHALQEREYKNGKSILYVGSPLQLSWGEAGNESSIFILDLEENKITKKIVNDVSPKFVKVKASEILEDPKKHEGNILEVIWDVEDSQENVLSVSDAVGKISDFSFRNNFQHKKETIISDIATKCNVEDISGILEIYTDAILDITDEEKEEIKKTGLHYLELTK